MKACSALLLVCVLPAVLSAPWVDSEFDRIEQPFPPKVPLSRLDDNSFLSEDVDDLFLSMVARSDADRYEEYSNAYDLRDEELSFAARSTSQFDPDLGRYAARVSFLTYATDGSQIVPMKCAGCTDSSLQRLKFTPLIEDQSLKIRAVVGYDSGRHMVVVAFRGTDNARNWWNNFKVAKTKTDNLYPNASPDVKVSLGFYQDYMSVRRPIVGSVKEVLQLHPDAEILVTGHSLGAALATICAPDIGNQIESKSKVRVYTFGSPRVGNRKFMKYFTERILASFRVAHPTDTVTEVPIAVTFSGYTHVPEKVADPYSYPKDFPDSHRTYMGLNLKDAE